MHDQRPCVVCRRIEDDPLHQLADRGGLANDVIPRVEQHVYDPGERRKVTRRQQNRTKEAWDQARQKHDVDEWNREHPKNE